MEIQRIFTEKDFVLLRWTLGRLESIQLGLEENGLDIDLGYLNSEIQLCINHIDKLMEEYR